MSNPCRHKIVENISYVSEDYITGECAIELQKNADEIRKILHLPKKTGGITRFEQANLTPDFIQQIKEWRNRENDRREFAGYLNRELKVISNVIISKEDSGLSMEEIYDIGNIDGILFHTHPIYKDTKIIGPPSYDDLLMIYLNAIRNRQNKINIIFAEEGLYLYCLYPEAFIRLLNLYDSLENKEYFEEEIKFNVQDHLETIMYNYGIKKNDKEFILPNINKEQYMEILRTIGIYIELYPYESTINIPIFDDITVDFLITEEPSKQDSGKDSKQDSGKDSEQDSGKDSEQDSGKDSEEDEEFVIRPLSFQQQQQEEDFRPTKKIARSLFAGDYKAKYLKYKTKYLELKKNIQNKK